MNNLKDYSIDDVKRATKTVYDDDEFLLIPKIERKAILLIGQPAAGKSRIAKCYETEYKEIDADDYRQYHPNSEKIQQIYQKDASQYTGEFAGKVCEELINIYSKEGRNILIHGTGRSYDTVKNTVQQLRKNNYKDIKIIVLACPIELSMYSIYQRYYDDKNSRFTDLSHVKMVMDNLPQNLHRFETEKLVDDIQVITRNNKKIDKEGELIATTLIKEVIRPLSEKEQQKIELIKKEIMKRNGEKGNDIIAKIDTTVCDIKTSIKRIEEQKSRLITTRNKGFSR